MNSSPRSAARLATMFASLLLVAPIHADTITFLPQVGLVLTQTQLTHGTGAGGSTTGSTNGLPRNSSVSDSVSGDNPDGGLSTVAVTGQAFQRSSLGPTGVSFDGSVDTTLTATNLYTDFPLDYHINFVPSLAKSEFTLFFNVTVTTEFTYDATLSSSGIRRGDGLPNFYFANNASPFTPLSNLTGAGSAHLTGILLPGSYTLRALMDVRTVLDFGVTEATQHSAAAGSFALNFIPAATSVPEGGTTAAALLLGLGLCWQARRRVAA